MNEQIYISKIFSWISKESVFCVANSFNPALSPDSRGRIQGCGIRALSHFLYIPPSGNYNFRTFLEHPHQI